MADLETVLTYSLLTLAAVGGIVAAYRLIRDWYFSTAFEVKFDGMSTELIARPDQEITLNLVMENHSHRPVSITGAALFAPKQFECLGLSVADAPIGPAKPVRGSTDGSMWGLSILTDVSFARVDSDRVMVRVRTPKMLGMFRIHVTFGPIGERPIYKYLHLEVAAD
jgi:hypothetical protein